MMMKLILQIWIHYFERFSFGTFIYKLPATTWSQSFQLTFFSLRINLINYYNWKMEMHYNPRLALSCPQNFKVIKNGYFNILWTFLFHSRPAVSPHYAYFIQFLPTFSSFANSLFALTIVACNARSYYRSGTKTTAYFPRPRFPRGKKRMRGNSEKRAAC